MYYSCDADPAALAKYVVALVKKDKPMEELKEICIDQLEVFLSDGEFGASQINVIIYYYYLVNIYFPFTYLQGSKLRLYRAHLRIKISLLRLKFLHW